MMLHNLEVSLWYKTHVDRCRPPCSSVALSLTSDKREASHSEWSVGEHPESNGKHENKIPSKLSISSISIKSPALDSDGQWL